MKILAIVDLHGNKKALDKLVERGKKDDIDVVVDAGDFTIFGEGQEIILGKMDKIGKPVLIVHGNHEDEDVLRKQCKKLKNCVFLHNDVFRKDGVTFLGWGGGGFSFRDRGFEVFGKNIMRGIGKTEKIVLVTHAPPYNTKIDNIGGERAGCKSIRKFIEKVKPKLSISGHLHEGVGEDMIGKTKVVNPGYKSKVIVI